MAAEASRTDLRVEEHESTWPDGVPFYSKRWSPVAAQTPRALLICLHGFAEHIGRYNDMMPKFTERGIEVYGYDQRGFGKSGPRHGDTTLRQAMDDLSHVLVQEREYLSKGNGAKIPIFLYGHSMVSGCLNYSGIISRPPTAEWLLYRERPLSWHC